MEEGKLVEDRMVKVAGAGWDERRFVLFPWSKPITFVCGLKLILAEPESIVLKTRVAMTPFP